ncbi:hypothetical protein MATL_G00107660 [Megalops atlanticus]|uniref:Uncharacterized protein n=1 Tax=Megalops atlanticus TaxID=7932 RepID=A0A9D3T6F8_MEGAT|nr:hypothetical protein MATL_G00107660 [Megalops atlanticus]
MTTGPRGAPRPDRVACFFLCFVGRVDRLKEFGRDSASISWALGASLDKPVSQVELISNIRGAAFIFMIVQEKVKYTSHKHKF